MSTKGYLPHSVIKAFVFWILVACLFAATASGILRSWGTIGEEVASRCLWTAFILMCGSVGFLIINCLFGDIGNLVFEKELPPNIDPAFSERLKKAKAASQLGEESNGSSEET